LPAPYGLWITFSSKGEFSLKGFEAIWTAVEQEQALTDTMHFVTFSVTMPYSVAEFDTGKQISYKKAMSAAAGTISANVDILSIIAEGRRRAGAVEVKTKIRATDAAGAMALKSTLSSGNALEKKINKELDAQGLEELISITQPALPVVDNDCREVGELCYIYVIIFVADDH